MSILQTIADEQLRRDINFRVGDLVKVHVRIKEGDKERIQIFEGVVISLCRGGNRASFTVRKVSYGTGVERIFPVHSPSVEKVEVVSSSKVRRAKLFYLRGRRGKAARLKERETQRVGSVTATPPAAEVPAIGA
jgi:large subunit ribosomal protein L19